MPNARGDSLTNVLHNVATFEPPPPSRIKPEVTHLLDLVIKRAMEKKPSDRYSSAWEMVDDVRHCLQELDPGPGSARSISCPSQHAGMNSRLLHCNVIDRPNPPRQLPKCTSVQDLRPTVWYPSTTGGVTQAP